MTTRLASMSSLPSSSLAAPSSAHRAPTAPPIDDAARVRATLARSPLLRNLPIAAIEDLTGRVTWRRVEGGETVLAQEEAARVMYVVASGRIKVALASEDGRELTLSVLRPGEVFGEVALFDGAGRSATCVAMEPCALLSLTREAFMAHVARFPQTALNLIAEVAGRLRQADDTIAQLALCDVNQRLILRLAILADEDGTAGADGILTAQRPTQQELANLIGSCRETISRALSQLARDGLITQRGRGVLVSHALMARAGRAPLAADAAA